MRKYIVLLTALLLSTAGYSQIALRDSAGYIQVRSGLLGPWRTVLVSYRNLADVKSIPLSRAALGLGTMATQNTNAVGITGGTATGLTSVGVSGTLTVGTKTITPDGVIGSTTVPFGSGFFTTVYAPFYRGNASGITFGASSGTNWGAINGSTGNWTIGGTTDDGVNKFQVNGSGSFTGNVFGNGGNFGRIYQAQNMSRTVTGEGLGGIQGSYNAYANTDNSTATNTTVPMVNSHGFGIPTFNASNPGQIYTNASTVFIGGSPVAGTNVSISNAYPLYVNLGSSYLSGITIGGTDIIQVAGSSEMRLSTVGNGTGLGFYLGRTATKVSLFAPTTGNYILQTGGTFTDNGAKLQVTGNETVSGWLSATGGVRGANYVVTNTNVSTSLAIDMSVSDNVYAYLTLTGNTTLTLSNYTPGKHLYLRVEQGGAGGFTLNFPAAVRFPGAAAIDWNTTTGTVNVFDLIASSTTALDGFYSKQ